jgi:hypothetical protein
MYTLTIFKQGYTTKRTLRDQVEDLDDTQLRQLEQDIMKGDPRRLKGVFRLVLGAIREVQAERASIVKDLVLA